MAGNEVRVTVKAKDEATKPIRDVQDAFERLKKRGSEGLMIGAGAAITAKGFDLMGSAISAATDYLAGSVSAAAEEEASIKKLDAALRANVSGWTGTTDAVEARMAAGLKLGFSDDALRESMTKLIGSTHDVDKALALQRTAMDLARLKGIGLAEASTALVKVEGGQYRALKELGIVLKEGATQTEALAAVQQVAQGQAAAYADTTAGKTETLSNKMADLQERIGTGVLPVVDQLTTGLLKLSAAADGTSDNVGGDLIDGLGLVSQALNHLNPLTAAYEFQMDGVRKRSAEASASVEGAADSFERLRAPVSAVFTRASSTGTLKRLGERIADIGDAADDSRYKLLGLADAIDSVTTKAGEDQYAVDELTSQYRLNTDAVADDIAKIRALEKIKHPTREQRADLEETRLKLIEDKKEAITLGTKMLAAGKVSYKGLITRLSELGVELRDENGHANKLLQTLRYISGESGYGGGGVSRTYTHRAAGGPVQAGQAYVVGEKRPELFVPSTSGTILPSVPQSAGGGVTVNVSVSAPVLTPGAAQAVADAIAPAITRWQQRRGL